MKNETKKMKLINFSMRIHQQLNNNEKTTRHYIYNAVIY